MIHLMIGMVRNGELLRKNKNKILRKSIEDRSLESLRKKTKIQGGQSFTLQSSFFCHNRKWTVHRCRISTGEHSGTYALDGSAQHCIRKLQKRTEVGFRIGRLISDCIGRLKITVWCYYIPRLFHLLKYGALKNCD